MPKFECVIRIEADDEEEVRETLQDMLCDENDTIESVTEVSVGEEVESEQKEETKE